MIDLLSGRLGVKAIFALPEFLINLVLPAPACCLPDSNSLFGENSHVVEEISSDLLSVSYNHGVEGQMVKMMVSGIDDLKGKELLKNGKCSQNATALPPRPGSSSLLPTQALRTIALHGDISMLADWRVDHAAPPSYSHSNQPRSDG